MSWKNVLGHDAARDRLASAFVKGRLAHAYLFIGPDGIGKRKFAYELAKALLCERNGGQFDSCDHCPACMQVTAKSHPDVHYFEREEDRQELTVKVIEEVVRVIGIKSSGQYKFAIIDDADIINEESANKLLKTLEEPPPGTIMILLGTSTDKQLPTIQSRCQLVRFQPLSQVDLLAVLQNQGVEGIPPGDQLARLCHGSPGQAVEVIAGKLWEFRDNLIHLLSGHPFRPSMFVELMLKRIEEAGKEAKLQRVRAYVLLGIAVELWRMIFQASVGALRETDPREVGRLMALAQSWNEDDALKAIEHCSEAIGLIERNVTVNLVIDQLADRLGRQSPIDSSR